MRIAKLSWWYFSDFIKQMSYLKFGICKQY